MLTISKPLSSGQANNYHRLEFVSADQNYWNKGPSIWSEWRGHLALQWGLNGNVGEREFALLSEGRSPTTEEQLIRHQARREYVNSDGEWVSALEHRAGWDATLSAPKSVSLTALVGGDERVREAHRESVRCALAELERLTHARVGSLAPPEVTGKFVAATFEHDTSRPVQDYAAPQLHTHAVIFNLTEHHGTFRALQPREFFRSQKFITAVYRSELAFRLANLGYEIEIGEYGQPEIRGYSQDYLHASSPRRQQILEYLETQAVSGPKAAEIAALCTRDGKRELTAQQVVERHLQIANEYGNQAQEVVESSYGRAHGHNLLEAGDARTESARTAVDYALMHDFERSAVQDKRRLFTSALSRSFGKARLPDISQWMQ
jgi:conjugative relaxase-like TrwC/TraI family protein